MKWKKPLLILPAISLLTGVGLYFNFLPRGPVLTYAGTDGKGGVVCRIENRTGSSYWFYPEACFYQDKARGRIEGGFLGCALGTPLKQEVPPGSATVFVMPGAFGLTRKVGIKFQHGTISAPLPPSALRRAMGDLVEYATVEFTGKRSIVPGVTWCEVP